jgi:ubiquitin C-terminal hydrolase
MNKTLAHFSLTDFLNTLPPSTRAAAYQAYESGVDLMAVAQQMANEPSAGLATKGGVFWPNNILQQIVKELHALLCTEDPRYETWRKKLNSEGSITAKVFVVLASSAVASSINFTVALCVPFVALVLAAIMKVGIEAWCRAVTQPTQAAQPIASGDKESKRVMNETTI